MASSRAQKKSKFGYIARLVHLLALVAWPCLYISAICPPLAHAARHTHAFAERFETKTSAPSWKDGKACTPASPCVHVVPHTHLDPGWRTTYDAYKETAFRIHDSVVAALKAKEERTFVFADAAFLVPWAETRGVTTARQVEALVKDARLDVVGGAWVSPDESLAPLEALVAAYDEGRCALAQTLPAVPYPVTAWQIDPFGHAASTPALLAHLGFRNVVLNRLPLPVKHAMRRGKALSFRWLGGAGKGVNAVVLPFHYNVPPELDLERQLPTSGEALQQAAAKLHAVVRDAAATTEHGHVLLLWGDDFRFYHDAEAYFEGIEAVIKEASKVYGVRATYSTPLAYLAAVEQRGAPTPTRRGGFVPYAEQIPLSENVWSGAYNAHPNLRARVHVASTAVRTAEAAAALLAGSKELVPGTRLDQIIVAAQRDAALALHHDAITGTCAPDVVKDYVDLLDKAITTAHAETRRLAGRALKCTPPKEGRADHFFAAFFNPLGWNRHVPVQVKLRALFDTGVVHVRAPDGALVPHMVVHGTSGEKKAMFYVDVPALGLAAYTVEGAAPPQRAAEAEEDLYEAGGAIPDVRNEVSVASYEGSTADGTFSLRLTQGGVEVHGSGGLAATLTFARYVFTEDHWLGWGQYVDRTPLSTGLHLWIGLIAGYMGGVAALGLLLSRRRRTHAGRMQRHRRFVSTVRRRVALAAAAACIAASLVHLLTQSALVSDRFVEWLYQKGLTAGMQLGIVLGASACWFLGGASTAVAVSPVGVAGAALWLWLLPELHARQIPPYADASVRCAGEGAGARCEAKLASGIVLRIAPSESVGSLATIRLEVDATVEPNRALVMRVRGAESEREMILDTGLEVIRRRAMSMSFGVPSSTHPLRGFAWLPRGGVALLPASSGGVAPVGGAAEVTIHRSVTSDDGRGLGPHFSVADSSEVRFLGMLIGTPVVRAAGSTLDAAIKDTAPRLRALSKRLQHPLSVSMWGECHGVGKSLEILHKPFPPNLHAITISRRRCGGGGGGDMPRVHLQHLSEPNSDDDDNNIDMAQTRPGTLGFTTLSSSSLKWTAAEVEEGE